MRYPVQGIVAVCGFILALIIAKLGYDTVFPPVPPSERKYVPPKSVTVVEGAGPLGCDFSGIRGGVPTGLMPIDGKLSVRLQIPNAYLYSPEPQEEGALGNRGAVLMYVRLDTFQPNKKEYGSRLPVGQPGEARILLWSIKPLDHSLLRLERLYPVIAPYQTDEAEGLTVSRISRDETLLYAKAKGRVTDIIKCSNPKTGSNPQCDHKFKHKSVGVSLSYNRKDLEIWRDIRSRTEAFLNCVVSDQ